MAVMVGVMVGGNFIEAAGRESEELPALDLTRCHDNHLKPCTVKDKLAVCVIILLKGCLLQT